MLKVNPPPRKDIHTAGVPVLCQSCEVRHKGICGALSDAQLLELSRHTAREVFVPGAAIARDGQHIERYANILNGVVKLAKLTSDGRQQIVGLQFAPDFMGQPLNAESGFDVEAATEVRVCSYPKSAMDRLVHLNPELKDRLLHQTLKELDEARTWILALGRKSAAEKVASFLHYIALHVDPERAEHELNFTFQLPLKRSDMADFLGLTIETVSRQLTKLRQAAIIDLPDNRTVILRDAPRLAEAAEKGED